MTKKCSGQETVITPINKVARVTRLGDCFLRWCMDLLNIGVVAQIFGLLSLHIKKLCTNFDKKMGWATFGPIIRKIIRSQSYDF
jgi:hypothetical protein